MGPIFKFLNSLRNLAQTRKISIGDAYKFAQQEFGEVNDLLKLQINKIFKEVKAPSIKKPSKPEGKLIEASFKPGVDKRGKVVEQSPSQAEGTILDRISKASSRIEELMKEREAMYRPKQGLQLSEGLTRALARKILDRKRIQIPKGQDPIDVFSDIFGESIGDVKNLADEMVEIDQAGGGMKNMDEMLEAEGLYDIEIPSNPQRGLTDEELMKLARDEEPEDFATGGRVGLRGGGMDMGGGSSKGSKSSGPAGGASSGGNYGGNRNSGPDRSRVSDRQERNNDKAIKEAQMVNRMKEAQAKESPIKSWAKHANFTNQLKNYFKGTPNYHQLGGYDFMRRFPNTPKMLAKGLGYGYQGVTEGIRSLMDSNYDFKDAMARAAEEGRLNALGVEAYGDPTNTISKQYTGLNYDLRNPTYTNFGFAEGGSVDKGSPKIFDKLEMNVPYPYGHRVDYHEGGDVAYDATNVEIYGSSAIGNKMNQGRPLGGEGIMANIPQQLTGNDLVKNIEMRMMQKDVKPEYWNAYAQDVIKTGGNPTKSMQEYQTQFGYQPPQQLTGNDLVKNIELDLPAVGGNNNVGGILPVMPPKSEYYTGKDYGPGNQAYTTVMPQPGMRYVYDEKGTRHSVPIEGYEGPTSGMPLVQQLSLSSYSDNIKSGLSPVASTMYAEGGRVKYGAGGGVKALVKLINKKFGKGTVKLGKDVKRPESAEMREAFMAFKKRNKLAAGGAVKTVLNIIKEIKKLDPMDAMKEVNEVVAKRGKYKNLSDEEVKKVFDETNDHIFERDVKPKETDVNFDDDIGEATPMSEIETVEAMGAPITAKTLQLMEKYPGLNLDVARKIASDPDPQRQAEVIAVIDQAFEMNKKGMSMDEIVDVFSKNTDRTKQAGGGLAYLMGL